MLPISGIPKATNIASHTIKGICIGIPYRYPNTNSLYCVTYNKGNLYWDNGTVCDDNGLLSFSVFDTNYTNVKSSNGQKVIAPGTEGHCVIRIKNASKYENATYHLTVVNKKTDEALPIQITVSSPTRSTSSDAVLPANIEYTNLVASQTNTLSAGQIDDYHVYWTWNFNGDDIIDTQLGNKAITSPDEDTIGVYVVAIDNETGSYIYSTWNTEQPIPLYVFILLCFVTIIVLLIRKTIKKIHSIKETTTNETKD